ncbi:hypothetical protein [Rhodobacter sp. SY28-1]|uniref:hypothetical protein n=1 Tax=Rhodobacter sp. SY28-1 TaxID=2562317 RepID=UPI0010C12DA9|nr:hypothetical protein [Rhodobacter sp. SY28-1]
MLLIVAAIFSVFPTTLLAQDYPQYDGVYLRLQSGEFVELPSSPRAGDHQLDFQGRADSEIELNFNALEGEGTYFSVEDFKSSPTVDVAQIASIVVVGPAPQHLALHPLVDARSKHDAYVNDPAASVEHRYNGSSTTMRADAVPFLLTRQQCANLSENMRIKRVGQFVTEYEPKQGQSWNFKVNVPEGKRACKPFSHDAHVMEVVLDGQVFVNFMTTVGRSSMSDPAGDSSSEAPSTTGDQLSGVLDGIYDELGFCEDHDDSEGYLKVTSDSLKFYSSECSVRNRNVTSDGLHQLVLLCIWSEGGATTRYINARKDERGGLLLYERGSQRSFVSCGS